MSTSKHDRDYFLDMTSCYDVNALRQIAEGMALHSKYLDGNEKEKLQAVARSINNFLALRNSYQQPEPFDIVGYLSPGADLKAK